MTILSVVLLALFIAFLIFGIIRQEYRTSTFYIYCMIGVVILANATPLFR